jgi:hypothetical protein
MNESLLKAFWGCAARLFYPGVACPPCFLVGFLTSIALVQLLVQWPHLYHLLYLQLFPRGGEHFAPD